MGISALDQSDKLANHARAFASKGSESLVLICMNTVTKLRFAPAQAIRCTSC